MSQLEAKGPLGKLLALPNDSTTKTLVVAVGLCLACAVLVSTAAVALKPIQQKNKALDRKSNILSVAGLLHDTNKSVEQLYEEKIEPRVIDLATGEYVSDVDPASYDQRAASKDPARSVTLTKAQDIASIKRRAKYASVYLVKDGDQVKNVILPVHGYGLWSTLYGFLSVETDGNTIQGLSFYEHAETPGLGGEVDNPKWKALWHGKKIYDESGKLQITLVKGNVDTSKPGAEYKVDALAGATLTSRGVTNLMHYWLSDQGFGPYLTKLRAS